MNNIINFSEIKENSEENKLNNKKLVLLIKDLFNDAKLNKCDFPTAFDNNINILETNYENINKKALNGNINHDEFNIFYNRLISILSNEELDFRYYMILFFYKIYSNYGNKLFELNNEIINQIIRTYSLFYEEENINVLDSVFEFLFNSEIRNEMVGLFPDYKIMGDHIINIAEEMVDLKEKTKDIILREYLNRYKKNIKEYTDRNDFEIGIITPKIIKEKMSLQLNGIIDLYYVKYNETNDNKFLRLAYELENNLDMLVYKLKNIKKEDEIKVYDTIRKIWTNEEIALLQKADMIFNIVDVVSKENVKTSIK